MMIKRSFLAVPALLLLAACGGGEESAAPSDEGTAAAAEAPAAAASAPAAPKPVIATRDQIEQIYRCRGILSAAVAGRMVLPENGMPEWLAEVTASKASYWNKMMAAIPPGKITPDEEAELVTRSTRIFASKQALEEARAEIVACLAATRG